MKILGYSNSTGSKFYRLLPQFRWMREQGHEVKLYSFEKEVKEQDIKWADVVIFEMVWSPYLMKLCKKYNPKIKIVIECDDLCHTVPKTHYAYSDIKGWRKIKWWWILFRTLRLVNGLIVTNEFLKRQYGWMCHKCLVFDNYIDLQHWIRPVQPNKSNRIRLLWAGSVSHTGDLLFLKGVLKKILKKYKNVDFIYIGHGGIKNPDLYSEFIYGNDLFEGLSPNRESLLAVPAIIWPHILASLGADIAMAPLVKNKFNKAKSQCKWLEYSLNEIPAVYSRWFYTKVKEGITGLTADTEEEWINAISKLIESSLLRKQIGQNAYKEVLNNHNILNYLSTWQEFIEHI